MGCGGSITTAPAARRRPRTPGRLEIGQKQFHNPTYHHPTIPGAWVGYPGTDGCENVCESEAIDEATCADMFFCVWDQDKCWSGVGPNNCPDTREEMAQMMNTKK